MQNYLGMIKKIGNIIVIIYPIYCLLYSIWLLYSTDEYWDIYWDGYYLFISALTFLTIIGFFIFLLFLFLSDLRPAWRILSSLFSIPMICCVVSAWFILPSYTQVDKSRFEDHKYFFLYDHFFLSDSYDWILLECPRFGIKCNKILLFQDEFGEYYGSSSDAKFVVDGNNQELHVIIGDDLLYTIGYPTREYLYFYKWENRIGDYTYHFHRSENNGSVIYGLDECNSSFACSKIPFAYITSKNDDGDFYINIDETTNSLIIKKWDPDSVLIFSYDGKPHCYVEACSIPDY